MLTDKRTLVVAAALAVVLASVLAACGGSEDHSGHNGGNAGAEGPGNMTDAMFVNSMIPHHEGAVQMAHLAQQRGEREEIKKLAGEIITSQETEIGTMTPIKEELAGEHGSGQMEGHGSMETSESDMSKLKTASPFDREFIDMMIPHHESAVKMAEEELAKGENKALRALAQDIIDAQKREIAEMREWRERWYGSAGAGSGSSSGHGSDGY